MLQEKIEAICKNALVAFARVEDSRQLYDCKVQFLGKKGELSEVMKGLAALSPAEKPAIGKLVNEIKIQIEEAYQLRESALRQSELSAQLAKEKIDLTLPGVPRALGSKHPISMVIDEIVGILARLGYSVRSGPQIESDNYNFEALNIPADHPARDMQDTFYIDENHVLRTHTSPVQIRTMLSEEPPLRIIAPGSVFRCDSDVSHSPNFHQIELLMVDRHASMAELRGTIAYFVREFFDSSIKVRFRPSFFPFTEPSAEVDCSCPICKGKGCRMCSYTGWVEIGGSGLVNPNVFRHVGIEYPKWKGFAFGFGVERMAIIKYGVEDIRLFSENDVRFLRQFPS
jgi:phenylalanyl-tRNA synthetase alpha chain